MHTWAPAVSDNMIIRKRKPFQYTPMCASGNHSYCSNNFVSNWMLKRLHHALCTTQCVLMQHVSQFLHDSTTVHAELGFCMMFSIIERRSDTCSRCQRMIKKISMFIAYGDVWIDVVCYRGCLSSGSWKLNFDLIVKHFSSCSSLSTDIKRRAQTELLWN